MVRSHVPFDGIWSMAIDVPYSYLLREGDVAWTCGQLALDAESNVMHPDDLVKQSEVVCSYVGSILKRAGLSEDGVVQLYLYHAAPNPQALDEMLAIFRNRFGSHVLLNPIAVPHFYYDGIVLEVDVWWSITDSMRWGKRSEPDSNLCRLSEHMIVPTDLLDTPVALPDPGAAIDGGRSLAAPGFHFIELPDEMFSTTVSKMDGVTTVLRRAGSIAWLQGRSTDETLGLVAQTEAIMSRFDVVLPSIDFGYNHVAKSTTHYVGGSTAAELHDNMSVRNRRYNKPGPASTGLPVYGFADPASKVVIDITLVKELL